MKKTQQKRHDEIIEIFKTLFCQPIETSKKTINLKQKTMKKFILINGKNAYLKTFNSSEDARTYVVNYFDHSLTVSYYEIDKIALSAALNLDIQ